MHNIIIILYYVELQESANTFSSMLTSDSSFALKLRTPETAHFEGTETDGNSGRRDFFPKSFFQQTASKTCFLELKYYVYLF
jgi:hypothetical protein